jgi:hypothetical protein
VGLAGASFIVVVMVVIMMVVVASIAVSRASKDFRSQL